MQGFDPHLLTAEDDPYPVYRIMDVDGTIREGATGNPNLGKEEVTAETWEARVAARQEELEEARSSGEAAKELCLLLDAAEEALGTDPFAAAEPHAYRQ